MYGEQVGEVQPPSAAQALRKLVKRSPVGMAYVEELQQRQGIVVTSIRNKVVEEYSALAFAKLSDVVKVDKEGGISVRAFDDLPAAVQSAIKKVKLVRKRSGGDHGEFEDILEIEMHDKKGALDGLSHVLNLQRRIDEELTRDDEEHVLEFAGVKIIGPQSKPVLDLSLPGGE